LRIEIKPWIFFLALAIAVGCATFFIAQYRYQAVNSNADLVALLPRGDRTVFFADFALLRKSGKLKLPGAAAAEEPEYKQFVRETHFDYTQDIDALAGAASGRQLLFAIRGRFDWLALRRYAAHHGGHCNGDFCRVLTREPDRWASFWPVQSDVMALLLGPAVPSKRELHPRQQNERTPNAPVWVELAPSLLRNPARLPVALRLFSIALHAANSVTLAVVPAPTNSADAFDVRLHAEYASHAAAAAVATQLELDTKLLKLELARENEAAGPASLAGLLTSGEFHSINAETIGIWPVREALLRALQ
jgi:hypothetical protein